MGRKQAAAGLLVAAAAAAILVSGGSGADPETPPPLPGRPHPFLGTALIGGHGGLAAAIDAYGSVVDLRLPAATGEAQIHNPTDRQNAGAVSPDTGIVIRAGAGRDPLPLWRADRLRQRYGPGTNVLRTDASVAGATLTATDAAAGRTLSRMLSVRAPESEEVRLTVSVNLDLDGTPDGDRIVLRPDGLLQTSASRRARCAASPRPDAVAESDAKTELRWARRGRLRVALTCSFGDTRVSGAAVAAEAAAGDRRWLARSRALGPGAPPWARALQRRSLLVLHALSDSRGAVAAGLRDRWAYVWPRDAAAGALALGAAGHRPEARRIARFLLSLDLEGAARFRGDGAPVPGRAAQGDAAGWTMAAARAAGVYPPPGLAAYEWRGRADYGERSGDSGDFLGNAIAAGAPARQIAALFRTPRGLVREAAVPGSGLDSAAAWAVRPFPRPPLLGTARQTLLTLARGGGRFGLEPAEDWPGEGDPWTAPTAWTAWALAAAGERGPALRLLAALRRAATPAGLLPERSDARTGVPRSTTPLGWSHAFAILALHELWPPPAE